MTFKSLPLALVSFVILGCEPRTRAPDVGMLPNWADSGGDAHGGLDASQDAHFALDAPMIVLSDAGGDSTATDAGIDAGSDASFDAGRGLDARGIDASGVDAGLPDVGPSDAFVGEDANSDVGCTPLPTVATTIMGTLPSGLTYNRPTSGCGTLSAVGTAAPYRAYTFCNTGGTRMISAALNAVGAGVDPFLVLYRGMGDPTSLMCLSSDDDGGDGSNAFISATINAGDTVTFVATDFDNVSSGSFALVLTPL